MLAKQKNNLKVKIERESRSRRLPALSEKILELAQDHGRISIKFISTTLEANRNTVKKHVQQLVKRGQLVRHSKGRGTYYSPCS
jgi:predicted ArsR family transcriptional regulator